MILDMIKRKEPPCCQERILENGFELGMQGKEPNLKIRSSNRSDVAWFPSRAKFIEVRVMEPQCRCIKVPTPTAVPFVGH